MDKLEELKEEIDSLSIEDTSEELLEEYNKSYEEYIDAEMKWYNSLL